MSDNTEKKEVTDNKDEKGSAQNEKKDSPKNFGIFGRGDMTPGKPKAQFNITWLYILIGLSFIAFYYMSNTQIEKTSRDKFLQMVKDGEVENVVIVNKEHVEITLKQDKLTTKYKALLNKGMSSVAKQGPHYSFVLDGSSDILRQDVKDVQKDLPESVKRLEITSDTRINYFNDVLSWLLPIFVLVAIWLFIFRRMGGGAAGGGAGNIFNVGK